DGGPNWWEIYNGAYAGSPIGCDSNASRNGITPVTNPVASVTSADIICTVLIFFGDATCANGTVQAAGSGTPALLRVADVHGEAGAQVQVPIVLTGGNQTIAAASFTIAYDSSQLTFDPTDGDGDGIPDALTFALPAGVQTWVRVEEGAIRIALAGLRLPLPHLADGTPVTVTFQVNATGSTVTLRDASFGDAQGNPLPAITQDGSVGSQAIQLFLPLITR
ncbi:MAG: hypothetical protein KDE19_08520, partial [Caldilineaceae bacterium]|nr:hypothetical protein [Caldilineaceae bacterium]